MSELKAVLADIRLKASKSPLSKRITGGVWFDTNPDEANNIRFTRVCKLECPKCHIRWSVAFEGSYPRTKTDIECYQCNK